MPNFQRSQAMALSGNSSTGETGFEPATRRVHSRRGIIDAAQVFPLSRAPPQLAWAAM
jgi:hypothetical protein